MVEAFLQLLRDRIFLTILLIINIGGTIYGYIWYEAQLVITPTIFLPFVPDSPTASLFFCFVLIAFLLGKNWPLIEAFAAVTLLKYGIWAVVLIIVPTFLGAELYWTHYMLIFSHLGMAIQGLLYMPYYRIKPWHIGVVAVWTLHNDVIDYIYGMYPWVHSLLSDSIQEIAYFTFWLSIASLLTVYILNKKIIKRQL
ncbi:DUF1405 domain-containing protein [Evansella sp. AB-P1]|uniref:DUF1405 domain-containing protein n=1 Tax=Evansella sp. AB-P1 TaxID=3037653 RepID=UPI00241FB4C2|nr:DUF1405 domain-containing protein [Evansella sp. AB-P1]MDG5787577.1 DUF1405 domain-containing protein [Evansella sp. AB-P1]